MNKFYKVLRFLPYIIIILVAISIFLISSLVENQTYKEILINIGSDAIFVFVGYLFYDGIKTAIRKKEKKELDEYIKNQIANDVFVVLYYLKKVLHGYNLYTSSLGNILKIINYSEIEIKNLILNQEYLGFQIYKQIDEIRNIFKNILNDRLFLKYSSHIEETNIIKINNTLANIEYLLKDDENFKPCAEKGFEYKTVNGKEINPKNDDKYLLLKKTGIGNRFVVYDSGFFNDKDVNKLLNRYVLKEETAIQLAHHIFVLFSLMKYWIPNAVNISRQDHRFRIIKNYFSPFTETRTINSKIYVDDIVDTNGKQKQN